MTIQVRLRRWGNSMGIILPKEIVDRQRLKENEKVSISIIKETDLSSIFGSLKNLKLDAQKFKDEMRKEEWDLEEKEWKQHLKKRHTS